MKIPGRINKGRNICWFLSFCSCNMGVFIHGIYREQVDWIDNGQITSVIMRSSDSLSGRKVGGVTVIIVPIPSLKEDNFVLRLLKKVFILARNRHIKSLTHKIFNWPQMVTRNPIKNATETKELKR